MDRPVPDFSIVVPAYNEAGNIRAIAARIAEVVGALGAFELIFVDDGSTDSTTSEIKSLAARDKRVRFVRFARNFGHQAALRAGLRHSRGAATVLMDADFEHPPEVIPALVAAWREGARIVVTERKSAGNSLAKRVTSRWFYRILDYIGDVRIEPGSADFLLMDRVVVDTINRLDDHDIFLRGLVRWLGYPLATVPYTQGTRSSGESKYTLRHMVRFAINGIVAHSIKPLRIGIYLSLAFAMLGVLLLAYSLVSFLWISHTVAGWSSIMAVMAVLGAGQFLVLGIIGEYVGRILRSTRGWPVYVIAETEAEPSEPAQTAVASLVRHTAGA